MEPLSAPRAAPRPRCHMDERARRASRAAFSDRATILRSAMARDARQRGRGSRRARLASESSWATSMRANMVSVPTVSHPDVSIVIVTYEGAEVVETALRALLENTEPCYELILIDNGSTDHTPTLLRQVGNATVVLNEQNAGFGAANNDGADRARGRYVLFLNQDAFVHRGWLPPLLERIESEMQSAPSGLCSSIRMARSSAREQCSSEQETRVATAKATTLSAPSIGLARDVDYLAGACLLTRRQRSTTSAASTRPTASPTSKTPSFAYRWQRAAIGRSTNLALGSPTCADGRAMPSWRSPPATKRSSSGAGGKCWLRGRFLHQARRKRR